MAKHPDQKFFRKLLNDFIKNPTFENWIHACAEFERDCNYPCEVIGVKDSLGHNDSCLNCPLVLLTEITTDEMHTCLLADGNNESVHLYKLLEIWQEHQGEILLGVVRFKEFWK